MALVDIYNNCTRVEPSGFTMTHLLTIINMLITAGVGVWLGVSFRRNYETTKSVRDYFIGEMSNLSKDYGEFVNNLCNKKMSPTEVLVWFKKTTIKLENFESVITSEFKVHSTLLKDHNAFKTYFTGTDFFNDNFMKAKLDLPIEQQHSVYEEYGKVSASCNKMVIAIIKCRRK